MIYDNIKILTEEAEAIILQLYNLKGEVKDLPGEIDLNFKIKIGGSDGYILKISRPGENGNYLDFQQNLLEFVEGRDPNLVAPKVLKDRQGRAVSLITDAVGQQRYVRLLTWVPGRVWSSVNPQLDDLRYNLGQKCGSLTRALQGFDHSEAHRTFQWDVAQALWTKAHVGLFENEKKEIVLYFQDLFEKSQDSYRSLRKAVVHNDANDNNIIVTPDLLTPKVEAVIDFGDAVYTQIINDLAVACAYGIMGHNDPLEAALPIIRGYHCAFPLQEEEIRHLYNTIAMRLVISVTKSALNKMVEPDNTYLLISEKQAWQVLKKWRQISPAFAYYSFRNACGFEAHEHASSYKSWAKKQQFKLSDLFPTSQKEAIHKLDLSVSSLWLGHEEEFNNLELFQFKISQLQNKFPNSVLAGGYMEPRALYTSPAYDKIGNSGRESRTVHLGIDFWLPGQTPVHAILEGEVVVASHSDEYKGYGGLVVLKHQVKNFTFFTLYGHLSAASVKMYTSGDVVEKGEKIGELGSPDENGNCVPHLHFQVTLSLLDYQNYFPGVTYHSQIEVWQSICPDPNLLFKSEALRDTGETSNAELIKYRKQHLGKSLSLQYNKPIKMVRGAGQFLMDSHGRKYLDTVNNVAHVGHEHYEVVKAGQQQMALINTNSRYLHENISELAREILETLPPELSVLHFVNSGSEANELAIRMVKAATGESDVIASEVGYHGNSNMCIDISSYKFDGKGGKGAPEHTHIFPLPDAFRGKYRGTTAGAAYAEEVKKTIETIHSKGRDVGALILEPIISCGGQIELPEGFLAQSYGYVRAAGGLCISDEVQTGCGRMGSTFWGFQLHGVIPDIVTIGKPLGNGHPVAAVACTQEVAEKFANGMEYFNTFGGNPVSCAIGAEVLKTVKREKLQEKAQEIGTYLKNELKILAHEFPIIGDVRGQGLFLGIELVDKNMKPLAAQTDYVANRMKDHSILMSTDGPDHNVLKIKPPLVFSRENAADLIYYLRKIFAEDFMQL